MTIRLQKKTLSIIDQAKLIMSDFRPFAMTVRQIFYQLVARQIVENTRDRYQAVSSALVKARKEGLIPWEWIEDRMRQPRHVAMWNGLPDFLDVVRRSYRREVWTTQPQRIEVWLEKDALSGIFEDALNPYGVTLNVARGWDGWSSIKAASDRLDDGDEILYYGDFDPSGEDMPRSLRDRLAELGSMPTVTVIALEYADIARYTLPSNFTKNTDTRRGAFVAKYGDVAVELDALPPDVLQARLVSEVEARMDLKALEQVRAAEQKDLRRLNSFIKKAT
jgi:hypothetical protein